MRAREPRARARVGAGRSSGAVIRLAGTADPRTSVAGEQSPSAIRRSYRRPTHCLLRCASADADNMLQLPRLGEDLAVTLSPASVPLERVRPAPA
mmetsp:Transcript_38759/g.102967  ORF Transcript_38759/g.102967 Transcript_38759/m.102967 type:complete len:95 (-) Transcript_38759:194-478(-)